MHDPGIGFVTLTRVQLSPDLQQARVRYSTLGDDKARITTAKALERAKPFLRQRIAARVGLRRAPELAFQFDESIAREERIESLLQEIQAASKAPAGDEEGPGAPKPAERSGADAGRSDAGPLRDE